MKWIWCILFVAVMLTDIGNTGIGNNPFLIFKELYKNGAMAWVESVLLTASIVLPGYFITKVLERLAGGFCPQLSIWKSLFFAICSTVVCYVIINYLLQTMRA